MIIKRVISLFHTNQLLLKLQQQQIQAGKKNLLIWLILITRFSVFRSFKNKLVSTLILLLTTGFAQAVVVVNQTTDVVGQWTATGNGTIQITITGADGGDGDEGAEQGGTGATMQATFNVTTGQVVYYVVGQVGQDGDGPGDYAGGGGSTGVFIDNTLVMVAGAGGGAGGGRSGSSEPGLGGNIGTAGDAGAGGGGAGGTNGTGGASNGDGGGGGGVGNPFANANGDGGDGPVAGGGSGATDFTGPLSFAAGGVDDDHGGVGGRGFTGGGGGAHHESAGGGGGYSGGGSGGFEDAGGGGGSFINTAASEYVSTDSTVAGVDGGSAGGSDADGSIIIDFTEVVGPVIVIDKDTTTPNVSQGGQATYSIVLNNTSLDTANEDLIVADTLPTGFTYASASFTRTGAATGPGGASSGALTNNGTAAVPEFGGFTIPNGDSITITLVVDVSNAQAIGTYSNAVTASSNTADFTDATDDGTDTDEDVNVVCGTGNLLNTAAVSLDETDPDTSDNTDSVCTVIEYPDYGDAPASYDDASHFIDTQLYIGTTVADAETASLNSANADGDSNDGTNDEGGVTFTSWSGGVRGELAATVPVVNDTGSDAYICAWLDTWDGTGNGDGAFDHPADAQDSGITCQTVSDNGGIAASYEFIWSNLPEVSGSTYARFRVCSIQIECNAPTIARASNGEVEDYLIAFDFTPTAVTIGNINLKPLSVNAFLQQLNTDEMSIGQLSDLLLTWRPELEEVESMDKDSIISALKDFLDPDGDGHVAILKWDTLEERGTIGFYVERLDEQNNWVRISDNMLPGLINAPMGGEYQLADPAATAGNRYQYRLIEQEATGSMKSYGPYTIDMQ